MELVPYGIWMPDEISTLQTAFGILWNLDHRGIPDDRFEKLVVTDLIKSARDGCHDPIELAQRCRAHLKAETASRISRRRWIPGSTTFGRRS